MSPAREQNDFFTLTNITTMQRIFYALTLLATIFAVGCSDDGTLKTVNVSGTVTLDGKPVEGAMLTFEPVTEGEGYSAFGATDASGRYKLQTSYGKAEAGTTPGKYKVTISKSQAVDDAGNPIAVVQPTVVAVVDTSSDSSSTLPTTKTKEFMPAKTSRFGTTDLERTVENKRENVFNFDLKSE
jgi:hypothetical protein